MAKNLNLDNFLTISRLNISKLQFFFQMVFVIFSINFRRKTKKIVRAVLEKNIKLSDFGVSWRSFREYFKLRNFFQKSRSVTFLPL